MDKKNVNRLLLIIDPQVDFIYGSLPVSGSEDIMVALSRYIERFGHEYKDIVFTMDQHPINHCSFKGIEYTGREPGQWSPHCIQYSEGASIYNPLLEAAIRLIQSKPDIHLTFIEKGKNPIKEEYSAFDKENRENRLKIYNIIDLRGIEQIDICGICGDVCVLNTIQSLIDMGFKDKINVIEEFCPSIDDGSTLHKFVEENSLKKIK